MCTCPLGSNGNPCAHQAAVALKYGIAGINFIPQRPEERICLAKLAIGDHKELHLQKFVHLHQNEHAINIDMDTNDYCVPMEVDSALPTTQDDTSSSQSSDEESGFEVDIQLQDILRLHKQVQDDIELKLKTTDNNFRACYMKYLEIYRKIISKARGQAPVAALATAFAHFRKDQNALKYIAYSSQQQGKNQSTTHINIKKKIGTHVFLAFCHCEAYSFAFPLQNVDQLDKRIFHRAVQNRTRRHFQ